MPRKQKMYHYIYKTTCQVTGRFYVGMHSTDDLEDGYLGSGKVLGYSIGKHGRENHKKEVLEFVESREALRIRENEIVNKALLAEPLNINLKYGGEGGWDHLTIWTPERRERRKAFIRKLWEDQEYRRKQAVNQSRTMSANHKAGKMRYDTFTGKVHSEETKKLIGFKNSIRQTGEGNSQYGKCWVTNGLKAVSIKKELLDEYLTNGYSLGRKLRH